ncbi:MAG: dephospho-CoA kinase [Proteobacteria bacterium]|nr:dephospho-CoA kinase [Pseudomonadota bacterium]
MAEGRAVRPLKAGLTGSIGMGKTETGKMFARLGVTVHDSDAAVHALYAQGGLAVALIAEAFPQAVREGRVDREILAQAVTGDDAAFERLEAIIHPLVRDVQRDFLKAAAARGDDLVVLDIPLLFETGAEKDMDAVIVVSAPEEVQRKRVLARPGMSQEKLEAIQARQVPDAQKRAKADFVVETGEGLDHAFEQVKRIVETLRRRAREQS